MCSKNLLKWKKDMAYHFAVSFSPYEWLFYNLFIDIL